MAINNITFSRSLNIQIAQPALVHPDVKSFSKEDPPTGTHQMSLNPTGTHEMGLNPTGTHQMGLNPTGTHEMGLGSDADRDPSDETKQQLGDQDLTGSSASSSSGATPSSRRKNISDILFELGPMKLPEDIKRKANTIYLSMPSRDIHRRGNRKFKIFSAIYEAYTQCGIPCEPITIAAEVGIMKSRIGHAISKFSKAIKLSRHGQEKNPTNNWSAIDYIKPLLVEFGINDEHAETIEQLGYKVLAASRELKEEKPQKVAKTLIIHWATINGFKFARESIAKMCGVSIATIDSIRSKIIEADNSYTSAAATPAQVDHRVEQVRHNNFEIIIEPD
jgi:transcription initiation factor TFIIIB Brf1 subunit/transcription initiation factor TFIIB